MKTDIDNLAVADLLAATERPTVIEAMRAFYAEADRRIAELPAKCWNKGRCCRFGEFGHRLYVTALEVVYYLSAEECCGGVGPVRGDRRQGGHHSSVAALQVAIPPITEDACPHARDGKCHVRHRRPLGCRIFYCDPAAQSWQAPLTEEWLAQLRTMHERLDVPYLYADWIAVLRAIGPVAGRCD